MKQYGKKYVMKVKAMYVSGELANPNIRNRKQHIVLCIRKTNQQYTYFLVLVVTDTWSCWGSLLTANLRRV